MPPDAKKTWEKPTLKAFASPEEAISYYSENGMLDHAAAIKQMSGELKKAKPKIT